MQKEAERQRKEAAERKFQERQAEKRRQKEESNPGGSSRGSTPSYNRSNSPPLPAHRNASQANSSNNSEFESGSIGLSSASEDDQVRGSRL